MALSVKVDVDGLIQAVRNGYGLEIDRDLADRMCSTIQPALQDLEAARAALPDADGDPSSFEQALLELAPERIRVQADSFRGPAR